MAAARNRDGTLLLAFVLSGVAALGYELLWTRLLSLSLGNETLGVLGVLAGFFAGMALGSFAFHDRARNSADPVRMFVRLEAVAAVYAAISPHVLHALAGALPRLLGPVAGDNDSGTALLVSVAVAGATLMPGTICMGATLPALVEARARAFTGDSGGRGLGRLYAANTLGATIGVLGTVFFLLPTLGITVTALVLSAVGLAAAGIAGTWGRRHDVSHGASDAEDGPSIDTSGDPDPDLLSEPRVILMVIGGAGLVGVGLEVVGVVLLSQILENTVYTFASVLAVYLLGTAGGAWIYQRFAAVAVAGRPAWVVSALLVALGLSVVLAAVAIANAPALYESVAPSGSGHTRHIIAELTLAVAVFAVPTVLMGAMFSHTVGLVAREGVGRAYAVNTLGSALAPFVFGVWLLGEMDYTDAFYMVAYAYLVVFGAFTWFRRFKAVWQIGAIVVVVGSTAIGPRDLMLVEESDGWKEIVTRETLMGVVMVSEKPQAQGPAWKRLRVGRHFRMGGATSFGERRMGHIPLLLAPRTQRGLFLGVGTGATLGGAKLFAFEAVEAVELVPAVLDVMGEFEDVNLGVRNDPRFEFHTADARRYLLASRHEYDVIVADLFHPARDGAGSLYAQEHFEAAREHLAAGGLFAQWVPLYQFDEHNLKVVIRTFLAVFPEVHSFLAIYNAQTPAMALIGRADAESLHVDVNRLAKTMANPVHRSVLELREMLGAYMLDREALVAFAGEGPVNRDLNPVITFRAPKSAYEDAEDLQYRTLEILVPLRTPLPETFLRSDPPQLAAELQEHVARHSQAITEYLQGEIERVKAGAQDSAPAAAMSHYLAAYAVEPAFAPARGMLYRLARQSDGAAETILPQMFQLTPSDPRVQQAYLEYLRRIGDEALFEQVRAEIQSLAPAGG